MPTGTGELGSSSVTPKPVMPVEAVGETAPAHALDKLVEPTVLEKVQETVKPVRAMLFLTSTIHANPCSITNWLGLLCDLVRPDGAVTHAAVSARGGRDHSPLH